MKQSYPEYWPQYFTATIHEWKHALYDDYCKEIIIDSLRFLVHNKRIELNAFVIMSNHIHIIWQPQFGYSPNDIQASFMKYTAQQQKSALGKRNPALLETFLVHKEDRIYQLWKRRSLSIELISEPVFEQKLDYIHYNPVRAGLCMHPEEYHYSSAEFYHDGSDRFGIITHYKGN